MPLQSLLNASRILLRGISQVFLQGDPCLGLACLLAIAVGAPPLLAGALLGGALGPLLARLLHCADSDIEAGLYGYNAVLIGMLLAFRFAWSPGLVSLVALGCLASVALQRLFLHGLRRRRWLPPYTLGFVLNGWWLVPLGAWLGLAPATHGGCFSCAWSGTAELAALAQGIGEIIFLGEPLAGLLVWLGLLLVSRPSAAWALAGAAASLPLAWLLGYDWASALAGFYGLNAALAGLALALRYRSVWPPLLGMGLAVALQPLFGLLGLPALTAPFILACLLCIGGERLYLRLTGSLGARLGRRFDSALLLVILASLLVVMIDSIDEIHQDYGDLLAYIEWGFTGIFLVEYLLRLYCSPKPLRYAFSFYGLVDLLAILPGFLALLYPDAQYLLIVRVIRMLRIFRVLKLRQYLSQANFLLTALRGSKQKIIVFFLTVMTLVTVFGALMYVVEGPEHGFTSIPRGIYWAIVTLTTVGFGDITPKTPLGQAIASLVMLTGYSIIAVPTGIFTAELATAMRQDPANLLQRDCPVCRKATHEVQAAFCCRCGNPLFPREEGSHGKS